MSRDRGVGSWIVSWSMSSPWVVYKQFNILWLRDRIWVSSVLYWVKRFIPDPTGPYRNRIFLCATPDFIHRIRTYYVLGRVRLQPSNQIRSSLCWSILRDRNWGSVPDGRNETLLCSVVRGTRRDGGEEDDCPPSSISKDSCLYHSV